MARPDSPPDRSRHPAVVLIVDDRLEDRVAVRGDAGAMRRYWIAL